MSEPMEDHAEDDFCPVCHARQVSLDLLELAAFNCLAAGVDPEAVVATIRGALDGLVEVDDEELTAATPTAGQA